MKYVVKLEKVVRECETVEVDAPNPGIAESEARKTLPRGDDWKVESVTRDREVLLPAVIESEIGVDVEFDLAPIIAVLRDEHLVWLQEILDAKGVTKEKETAFLGRIVEIAASKDLTVASLSRLEDLYSSLTGGRVPARRVVVRKIYDFHFILAANRFPTAIRERARVELREIVKRTPPGEKWKTIDDARAKKARDSVLLTRFGSDDSGEKPAD